MSTIKVAVIVLNYRGEHVLARCLASLATTIREGDAILLVDNGQETSLMQEIATQFPRVEIVSAPENRGFAAGMNFGIEHMRQKGGYDAYWLFNNDAVALPDTLDELKAALRANGDSALYSPVIYPGPNQAPWFAGGELNFFRMRTEHRHVVASQTGAYATHFLTGCALLITQKAISQGGLLDERYFLYYEDAEYSLRVRRLGLKLLVVPTATVYHSEESRENPAKTYWLVRSGAEFFLRESRGWQQLWVRGYYFLRKLKNALEIRYAPRPLAREVERAYTDISL